MAACIRLLMILCLEVVEALVGMIPRRHRERGTILLDLVLGGRGVLVDGLVVVEVEVVGLEGRRIRFRGLVVGISSKATFESRNMNRWRDGEASCMIVL